MPFSEYKTASVTFLPDLDDSENGWAGFDLDNNYNRNDCSAYPLNSCPTGGICDKCSVGNKYKLKGCHQGYIFGGTKCTPLSCSAVNPTYKNDIPVNQICTRIIKGNLTCFKDCRPVSCGGYTLFCGAASSVPHFESIDFRPECLANNNSNCEPRFCRIKSCTAGYKVSADGTKCVEKDDTCPNGYYKTCETGTQGDPKYTERGTSCYQCKPAQADICEAGYSKTCPYDTFRYSSKGMSVNMSCLIKDSDYNTTFCKMDYCAIDLNKIDQYNLSSRTKDIINTYVRHEINQKLIDDSSATTAVIYAFHADNETVSFRDYATGAYLNKLLHGCGACSKYIGTHKKMTISPPRVGTPCYPDTVFTSCAIYTSTGYAHRMIYNPDRLKESRGEKDCYKKIMAGEDWCRLSSEKVYEYRLSGSGYI